MGAAVGDGTRVGVGREVAGGVRVGTAVGEGTGVGYAVGVGAGVIVKGREGDEYGKGVAGVAVGIGPDFASADAEVSTTVSDCPSAPEKVAGAEVSGWVAKLAASAETPVSGTGNVAVSEAGAGAVASGSDAPLCNWRSAPSLVRFGLAES